MDDLLREFLTESSENLLRLEQEIVELEQRPDDKDLLGSIFRTIHTIKGTCGFLELVRLEGVAHAAENVLGALREGDLTSSDEVISDVLLAVDVIKEILEELEATQEEPQGDDSDLIGRLDRWLGGDGGHDDAELDALFAAGAQAALVREETEEAGVAPAPVAAAPVAARAPEAPTATRDAPPEEIEVDPAIEALAREATRGGNGHDRGNGHGAGNGHGGGNGRGAVDAPEPPAGRAETDEGPPRGSGGKAAVADTTLRVDVGVLDRLMNLAGELVLTRNQLIQLSSSDDDSRFNGPVQQLNRVTTDLQEAVMKTRMQPVGNAWGKLPRLVRDLAKASGKKIELEMIGAETELDRQILQAIRDPLTHMIRNSADHGIEEPEVREAAGKSPEGHITLEAFHEGGHIVLEIRDDGKGIDVEAVRAKAVERGLVDAEAAANLSDHQVFDFIFHAGFSTAKKVTNVSGRGVGMDVVRRNMEQIGGSIDVTSTPGVGSVFRVKIPLTLAIMSALVVGTGGQSFAIPQIGVVELVRIAGTNQRLVERIHGSLFFRLRDALLPLVRLNSVLGLEDADAADLDRGSIVVCQVGSARFGLVVDEILDTQEIVVKPAGRMVKNVRVYAGTTILGDGTVIMILDIPGIAHDTDVMNRSQDLSDGAGAKNSAETAQGVSGDRGTSILLFDGGTEAPRGVPLAQVARLEEVRVEDLEWADGRWVIQYRGDLLPIIPANPEMDLRTRDPRPVIVFSDGDRPIGLAVEEIQDIVQEALTIQAHSRTPGLIGTAVVAGRTTEMVDIDHFIRVAYDDGAGPAEEVDDGRPRVLIVDDSPFFLNLLAPILRSEGYRVTVAHDGQQALDRLERGDHFDLVVSDIDMPSVNGFEFVRRVRGHDRWRGLPVIALTARDSAEDKKAGREAGFNDYLRKFDQDSVVTAVRTHLAHPAAAQEVMV